MLLFGTQEEIAMRVRENQTLLEDAQNRKADVSGELEDFDLAPSLAESVRILRELNQPPQLPDRLSPSQAAQLAELFEYFHARLGEVVETVQVHDKKPKIEIDLGTWQLMLQMYSRLSELIRGIADPEFRSPG
jgi:hypothetical protein